MAVVATLVLATGGVAPGVLSADGTTIDFWHFQDVTTDTTIKDLAVEFENQTGIKVVVNESIAQPQFYDSLVNAIAAGNAPDAAHVNTNMMGQMYQQNILEPLDSYIASWPGKDDVTDSMWDFVKSPDGEVTIAMPWQFLMFYMYYRTDLFAEAGIEVPTTQEEFVAAAAALTDPSKDRYGFDFRGGPNGQDQWAAFLVAGGARFLDETGAVVFDSPEAKRSNDLYLSTVPYAPPGAINSGYTQISQNFQSGTAAMIINHLGLAATLEESNGEQTGVALIPSATGDPTKTTYMGTMDCNVVLASSDKKDAAFQWIAFLAEKEPQLAATISPNGYLPVVDSVAADPRFADNRYFQISVEAAKGSVASWPILPGTTEATQVTWQPLFQGAVLGLNSNDAVVEGVAESLRK